MSNLKKISLSSLLIFLLISTITFQAISVNASSSISFIALSKYNAIVDIGNEFYILAIATNGDIPTWKSSNSKVASVNTYGRVLAKKSGTATITAKIKNAEASCKVVVSKTEISISKASASIERGQTINLSATTSNNSQVIWKSSKKSVATINEAGTITAIKPGDALITATADGSTATCRVKVKYPIVSLNETSLILFRGKSSKLSATVSSGIAPSWKTDKKSVAIVDEYGTITAVKHGTASITATVDGVSKACKVTVKQPNVALNSSELSLKKGTSVKLVATVSSGNFPMWSSSNQSIASVDSTGIITALQKGKAYIYAIEDGVKAQCRIQVTE